MSLTWEDMLDAIRTYKTYDRYVATNCPFHDDSRPSLLVFKDGWFRCMTCEAEGPWVRLYNRLQGANHRRAPITRRTEWVAPDLPDADDLETLDNIAWSAHNVLVDNEHLQWWLKERGVDGRIEPCILGWYDGWYTIPVFTNEREFCGMVLRASPPTQETADQRFYQPHGQKPMLYIPDWHLVESHKVLFIVFGMFDALALAEMRYPVCTTTGGKDSFDPLWLRWCHSIKYVLPDEGEEKAAQKLAMKVKAKTICLDYPDGVKDPADYLWQRKRKELHNQLAKLM